MEFSTWQEMGSIICLKPHLWKNLARERILACKEDMRARGVQAGDRAIVPEDFYKLLVEDIMQEGSRIYTF